MNIARASCSMVRHLRTSSVVKSVPATRPPGYAKLDAIKEKFNLEDGNPIHLKAGARDRIMYAITMLACMGALGFNVKLYYDLAVK